MSSDVLHEEQMRKVSKRVRNGTWRETALSRSSRLRPEARWMLVRGQFDQVADQNGVQVQVFAPLDRADAYASSNREGFLEWWGGNQVEESWRMLRQAEEGLLEIVAAPGVRARAQFAENHALQTLGATDLRVQALQKALADKDTAPEDLRTVARAAIGAAHEASDLQHQKLRGFRNQLFVVTCVLVLAAALLFVLQTAFGLRVIAKPADVDLSANEALAVAMFFGCVGALFSAVPSLAVVPTSSSPFSMVRQQGHAKGRHGRLVRCNRAPRGVRRDGCRRP